MAVGIAFLMSVPIGLILKLLRALLPTSDELVAVVMSGISFVFTFLLLPEAGTVLGMQGPNGKYLILLADCLILPCAYMAQGIITGFAMQCSSKDGWYSIDNFQLVYFISSGVGRFFAPAVARAMLGAGGRSGYAILQIGISGAGCITCGLVHMHIRQSYDERAKS